MILRTMNYLVQFLSGEKNITTAVLRSTGIHAGKQHMQSNRLTVVVCHNESPRYHLGQSLCKGEGGAHGERTSGERRRPRTGKKLPTGAAPGRQVGQTSVLPSQSSGPLLTRSTTQARHPILMVLHFTKTPEAPDAKRPGWVRNVPHGS